MKCPRCSRPAEVGQRFCNGCGLRLAGVTDGASPPPGAIGDDDLDTTAPRAELPRRERTAAPERARPSRVSGHANPEAPPSPTAGDDSRPTIRIGEDAGVQRVSDVAFGEPTWDGGRREASASAEASVWAERTEQGRALPNDTGIANVRPVVEAATPTRRAPAPAPDSPRPPSSEATTQTPTTVVRTTPAARPTTKPGKPRRSAPASPSRSANRDAAPATTVQKATVAAQPDRGHTGSRLSSFRWTTVTVLAAVASLLTLISIFTNILTIRSSVPIPPDLATPDGFRVGHWMLGDLGGNLPVAGLIAACAMMAGSVASGFGWKWGAGLAGGGGLAYTGIVGLALGITQMPVDAAHEFAAIPTDVRFTLSITRDLGYWMLIAVAALCIILFFASLQDCIRDRRHDLNPWIAALGALATVVTIAGTMIPVNGALISDNWFVIVGPGQAPALLVAGRLVQLGLLGIGGVAGFLLVRRYGLGLAIGSTLPTLWLGLSVLVGLTSNPVGPGWRNPGANSMRLHGVTIIGLAALLSMVVLATVAAWDQSSNRGR